MNQNSISTPWWNLHVRVAKGETLSDAERSDYENHTAVPDPLLDVSTEFFTQMAHARRRLAELSREGETLNRRQETLELEKQKLEAMLSESTRNQLLISW